MKSESAAFLQKSREAFDKAQGMLPRWPDEAGRAAYLAGLHAAQALIFENTGKVIKRHRGVQRELARLMKDQQRFDADLRAFLGRTYNLKAIADYETGPGSHGWARSWKRRPQTRACRFTRGGRLWASTAIPRTIGPLSSR